MLTILKYPNPILNQVSVECGQIDFLLIQTAYKEMVPLMTEVDGMGLAAVQVGILKRFCLLKNKEDVKNPYIIINPVIIETLEPVKKDEGCLSLPMFYEPVDRFEQITVEYLEPTRIEWIPRTAVFTGLESQCLQHEIEHFDGKLLINKLSTMRKQMYDKKLSKKGLL